MASDRIPSLPVRTVVKMLRIALGYGSRTERIQRLLHSTDPDVVVAAQSLRYQGFLKVVEGTVTTGGDETKLPWAMRNPDVTTR